MRRAATPLRALGPFGCALTLVLALAGPTGAQQERPLPALAPGPEDALSRALETGAVSEEEYALERARSVFELGDVRREFGDVDRPSARGATLYLRDLLLRLPRLSGADRETAEAILARPDDPPPHNVPVGNGWTVPEAAGSPRCSLIPGVSVCVHWVDSTGDAPPDSDWVDDTLATLEEIWMQQIDTIGYDAPLPDDDSDNDGGGPELDVYLDDVGAVGVFGYCTSDDPDAFGLQAVSWMVSAWCVLDNDFLDFGGDPLELLQVTAAHEFFHAVQFAYDFGEDAWLMEGTATNMETTIYPDVRDNVFFLRLFSPMSRPPVPLDRGGFGDAEYGSWIFWRFLEEKVAGGDPAIIRRIWNRAAVLAPVDIYSLLAVRKELKQNHGLEMRDAFQQFARANRLRDYAAAESAAPFYPVARRTRIWGLGPNNRTTRWKSWAIDHLASRHFSFVTGRNAAVDGRLQIRVRLPKYGAKATVIVVYENGTTRTRYLTANRNGVAGRLADFGRNAVERVDLVLTNGSVRTRCWRDPGPPHYSCQGRPRDDGQVFEFFARVRP